MGYEKGAVSRVGRILGIAFFLTLAGAAICVTTPEAIGSVGGDLPIMGEGHCFEVTNSSYLDVTLCSSAFVGAFLQSYPRIVSYFLESRDSESSTVLSVKGLVPGRTYYRYQDGHMAEEFVADDVGAHTYIHDLSKLHDEYITEKRSTIYLKDDETGGDCSQFGDWTQITKTCVLNQDVNDAVVFDDDGITLDGAGHSIQVNSWNYGIYAESKHEITIRNVAVNGGGSGIRFFDTDSSVIDQVTLSNTYDLFFFYSDDNSVSDSTFSGRGAPYVYYSAGESFTGCVFNYGAYFMKVAKTLVAHNSVSWGILISDSEEFTFKDNSIARRGIQIAGELLKNWNTHEIDSSNTVNNKPIYYCRDSPGVIVPDNQAEVILANCPNAIVQNRQFADIWTGVLVGFSPGTQIRDSTFSGSGGIQLHHSENCVVSDNTFIEGGVDLTVHYSSYAEISGNTVVNSWPSMRHSIEVDGSNGIRMEHNVINKGEVSFISSTSTLISDNVIFSGFVGIYLFYADGSSVLRNQISSLSTGLQVGPCDDCVIADNSILNNIAVGNSNGIVITDNFVSSYVFLNDGTGATLRGNTLAGGSITILRIPGATLERNTLIGGGISIQRSTGATLEGNVISGGGIVLSGDLEHWNTHEIDQSNKVNGKPVYYLKDAVGGSIPSGYGDVILANCANVVMTGLDQTGGYIGLQAGYSTGITVSDNAFRGFGGSAIIFTGSGNSIIERNVVTGSSGGITLLSSDGNWITENAMTGGSGISLQASDGNHIRKNTVIAASSGIKISSSEYNDVMQNTFSAGKHGIYLTGIGGNIIINNVISNNDYGIRASEATGNTLYYNEIIANTKQVSSENSENIWDNGAGEGNYWSEYDGLDDGSGGRVALDGIGDTKIPHQGVDSYPLMLPWFSDPFWGIDAARNYINGQDLSHGIKNSLVKMLDGAERELGHGKNKTAVNILESFVNQVLHLWKDGKLTLQQAQPMGAYASGVIRLIRK